MFTLLDLRRPQGIKSSPFRRGTLYVHVYVKYTSFFLACYSPAAEFFLALSAAGQARRPSVHYDACLSTPGQAPWRCSEHPTSLSWLFFSWGCVPPRCSSRARAWKTPRFVFSPLLSSFFVFNSLSRPPYSIVSPTAVSASLLSATTQQQRQQRQHSLVTAADGVSVSMCVCVCLCVFVGGVCGVVSTQKHEKER